MLVNGTDQLVFSVSDDDTPLILDSALAKWKTPVHWRTITTQHKIDAMRNGFLQMYDDAGRRTIYRNAVVALLRGIKRLPEVMASNYEAAMFHLDFSIVCVLRELLFGKPLPKYDQGVRLVGTTD